MGELEVRALLLCCNKSPTNRTFLPEGAVWRTRNAIATYHARYPKAHKLSSIKQSKTSYAEKALSPMSRFSTLRLQCLVVALVILWIYHRSVIYPDDFY
jgi:hypothetical protein